MLLQPGDTLERYVIEDVLGKGGMGVVYRAYDSRLRRRVALKVLHEGPVVAPGSGTSGSARILCEARAVAMLEHPNVVATYDVGEVSGGAHVGTAYLAMEYVDGRSLRSYVGDSSIPLLTRVRWLADVARALQAAHDRSLVHRDVKPENVIVRADGVVKVLDFGIAKRSFATSETGSDAVDALRTLAGEGLVVGTPHYMAPEQMRGGPIDAKADQFAWGVTAYELLTGALPWGEKHDAISLVAAVLSDIPSDPRERNPSIPSWLALVILQTLAKSPQARFPSLRDVVTALDAGDASSPPAQLATGTSLGVTKREHLLVYETPAPAKGPRFFAIATGCVALAATVVAGALRLGSGGGTYLALKPTTPTSAPSRNGEGCTSNSACTASLAVPAICRPADGACVALASPDCRLLADEAALRGDDTLWIGGLYGTTGKGADWGKLNEEGAELARQDFAGALSALRASSRHVRPIGLVSCDYEADVQRAARHLVDDLRVPAVIDSQNSGPLIELVGTILGPHEILTVATSAQSPLVTQIPHPPGSPPLVWRTANNATENALAVGKIVESELEPVLRAGGAGHTRVAVLRIANPTGLAVTERFFGALRFNGKSALENGDDYRDFVIDANGKDDAAYAADVTRLRAFAPNIVLALGSAAYLHVIRPYEETWRGSGPRPFYLATTTFDTKVVSMIGKNEALRRRFFGVNPTSTTGVNALFTMHLNEVFKGDVPRDEAPRSDYDAFYLLAYASYALGELPATGPNLANAMRRLVPPGPVVNVGPDAIFQGFTHLAAGESIDLNGAGGNLDFDLATGEHQVDLAIMCIAPDSNGVAHDNVESGLVYSPRTGELTGRLRCP